MIVGPTVASESDAIALYGTEITIAGQTRETIRTIQEQEGFLLRTWGERQPSEELSNPMPAGRFDMRPQLVITLLI